MPRTLSFEKWKELLRNDCIACDKVRAFDSLGDAVLKLLYENRLDPTVQAIVTNGCPPHPRSRQTRPRASQ